MASFLNCSTELADIILEQVSFRDLAAVSLVNKQLHKFATPHLYSQVNFSICRDNPRPIIHLARTIFKKPELAKLVTSVRLRDGEKGIQEIWTRSHKQYSLPPASPPHPTADDGLPEFISFISESGLSYADIWIENLQVGDLNAFVALLISKLHNLRLLRVGYAVTLPFLGKRTRKETRPRIAYHDAFLGQLFQSAIFDESNHGLPRFEHLQDIFFPGPLDPDPGPNPDFCDPRGLLALLNLPSLRSISGWCFDPRTLPFTWPLGPPDLANLTSLSLTYVHVDFLAQVLARTPNLKIFSWERSYLPNHRDQFNTTTIDLDKFVEALMPVQETLEDLSIKLIAELGFQDRPNTTVLGTLNGLKQFTSIKRLWVPFGLLLPDLLCLHLDLMSPPPDSDSDANAGRRLGDSLPRNVEVITLSSFTLFDGFLYDESYEFALLKRWLEEAKTSTPHLDDVIFYMKSDILKLLHEFNREHRVVYDPNVRFQFIESFWGNQGMVDWDIV